KAVQAAMGAFLVALLGATGWYAYGPRTGATAAWIAALYPPLVWYPAYALSETLYSLLALGAALALQRAVDRAEHAGASRAGGPLTLLAGGLTGAAVLTRPAMLLFLPLAAIWLATRRRPTLLVALLAATAAVVLPWTARNY